MIRLVLTEGGSNKFWEAKTKGEDLVIRFGRIGTKGQEQVKSFSDAAAARAELAKREKEKRASGYVEETTAKEPKKRAAAPSHPFLFYGRRPADWLEGSNMGYRFDVRFAGALDAATAKKAETAFRKSSKRSRAVELDEKSWVVAGEWATLFVGDRYVDWTEENGDSIGLYDELWDDLAQAFIAVHAVAPIAEVVNRNVRDYGDTDAWSEWSIEQKAEPGAPDSGPFGPEKKKKTKVETAPKPAKAGDEALDAAERAAEKGDEKLALRSLPGLEGMASKRAFEVLLRMFHRWGTEDDSPFKAALTRAQLADADAILLERLVSWTASTDVDDSLAASHLFDVIAARRPAGAVPIAIEIARKGEDDLHRRLAIELLAAYSAPEAIAEVRAWLERESESMDVEYVVQAIVDRGEPAVVFELLSPHVIAYRKKPKVSREIATRALFSLSSAKGAIDPRWCAVAYSVLDGPGDLPHYAPAVVAAAPAKERADLLLERARKHTLSPAMLEVLAGDARATPVLERHLGLAAESLVVMASARALLASDPKHRAKVIAALGAALRASAGVWGIERLVPYAVTFGKDMAAELDRAIADWSGRTVKGAASKQEQKTVITTLKAARARLA